MTDELARVEPAGQLQPPAPAVSWEEQIDLIRATVAAGATDAELGLFLYQARRMGLDPLAKQIYCIKRGGRMAIQTSIDGYRLIADRTGKYVGNDDPVFELGRFGLPVQATVTVKKLVRDQVYSFTATARWDEYYPGDQLGFMWKKMPFQMLAKCAEALALRKAFPAELSGLYTDSEMLQAGYPDTIRPEVMDPTAEHRQVTRTTARRISEQGRAIIEDGLGSREELRALACELAGVEAIASWSDLSEAQGLRIVAHFDDILGTVRRPVRPARPWHFGREAS